MCTVQPRTKPTSARLRLVGRMVWWAHRPATHRGTCREPGPRHVSQLRRGPGETPVGPREGFFRPREITTFLRPPSLVGQGWGPHSHRRCGAGMHSPATGGHRPLASALVVSVQSQWTPMRAPFWARGCSWAPRTRRRSPGSLEGRPTKCWKGPSLIWDRPARPWWRPELHLRLRTKEEARAGPSRPPERRWRGRVKGRWRKAPLRQPRPLRPPPTACRSLCLLLRLHRTVTRRWR